MEPGRWRLITDIYHATIARPPDERASFLGEECHGDESLRKQVEAMVKSHERSGNFIESPAFEVAPELLINDKAGAFGWRANWSLPDQISHRRWWNG